MAFSKISEIDVVLQLYDAETIDTAKGNDQPVEQEKPADKPVVKEKSKPNNDESLEDSLEDVSDTIDEEVIVRETSLEKMHDSYARHTEAYKQFHKEYIQSMSTKSVSDYYREEEETKWDWGDELITYEERKEYVRSTMMNAIMHGNHNQVDPGNKERYEFWKTASKFNWLLSTMLYDTMGQG